MSTKILDFTRKIPAPANLFNYKVFLKQTHLEDAANTALEGGRLLGNNIDCLLSEGNLPVHSAQTPRKQAVTRPITVNGVTVDIPVKSEVDRTWQCFVYEDNYFDAASEVIVAWDTWLQNELPSIISVQDYVQVQMLVSNPTKLMMYPVMAFEMSHAFIKAVEPVQLSWSDTQNVFAWSLQFGFADVKYDKV